MGLQGRYRTRVHMGETDAAGVVFYANYFGWFDAGTHGLLRGGDATARGAGGIPKHPFPVVACGATYLAPLRFDDEIEVVSTVTAVGTTSLRIEHEVRLLDGTLAARGFEQRVHVALDGDAFAKAPIPAALRARLADEPR